MAAANDGQGLTLRYRVDGMDCPSCVGKLQTALGRIEGVSGVEVNFATGLLAFGAAGAAANGRAWRRRADRRAGPPHRLQGPDHPLL